MHSENRSGQPKSNPFDITKDAKDETTIKTPYFHWRQFALESTLHGCNHTQNHEKQRLFRYVWTLILVSMFAALGTALALLWVKYTSYPFRTVWKLSRETFLYVPELTVCLRGEFDTGKADSWAEASDYVRNRWTSWSNISNTVVQLPYSEFTNRFGFDETDVFLGIFGYDLDVFRAFPVSDWVSRHPDPGRACWTMHQMKGDSSNNDKRWRMKIFRNIIMTFNPMVTRVGNEHPASGIELYLHDLGGQYWYHEPINLMPGSYVDVRFTHEIVKFLQLPYRSAGPKGCLDTEDPAFVNPLTLHDVYSLETCLHEAIILEGYKRCGCAFQPFASKLNVEECTLVQFQTCYLTMQYDVVSVVTRFQGELCLDSCVNLKYKSSRSYAELNTEVIRPSIPLINGTNVSAVPESDMKNLIYVQLQAAGLDVTTVEHVPELTLLDIFAQIGGFMGLFLGASLMTWLEIIDVTMMVGWACVSVAFRRLRHGLWRV